MLFRGLRLSGDIRTNNYHYVPDVYEVDAERRNGTSCLPEQHLGWRWGLVWLVCVGTSVMFMLSAVS